MAFDVVFAVFAALMVVLAGFVIRFAVKTGRERGDGRGGAGGIG